MSWEVRQGHVLTRLRELSAESVHCVVTSPPYYNLRDYETGGWVGGDPQCEHRKSNRRQDHSHGRWLETRGEQLSNGAQPMGQRCYRCGAERVDEQIGLEETPDEYVAVLVEVFREVRRVLRPDGVAWLNLGDTYNNRRVTRPSSHQGGLGFANESIETSWADHAANGSARLSLVGGGLKEKDLLMIPARVALALQADGWWIRSEVVWSKPNPLPESIRDRPTQAHEKVFLLTRSGRYFYDADAIREPYAEGSVQRIKAGFKDRYATVADAAGHRGAYGGANGEQVNPAGRNRRNVWEVATQPYPDAHFATFPVKLVEPCVLAGSSPQVCGVCGAPWCRVSERVPSGWDGSTAEYRTVGWQPSCEHGDGTGRALLLDPFAGSGTVGVVCEWHGRDFLGIELSSEYAALARQRIEAEGPIGRAASRPRQLPAENLSLFDH